MATRIGEITLNAVLVALKSTSAPGVGVSLSLYPETSAQYKIYNSIRRFEKGTQLLYVCI